MAYCLTTTMPNGNRAIVRMSGKRPNQCVFCDATGTKLCDWKTEKPVKIPHAQLSSEDTIFTVQHHHQLKVQGLQRFERAAMRRMVAVTMYGLEFPDGRCFLYYHWSTGKISGVGARGHVMVLRPGT